MSTAAPGETPDLLTIGELARWADVTTATLRHYQSLGLLDPVDPRSDPPLFPATAVELVHVVLLLDAVGFTPRETRELLDARSGSARSWRQLTERKLAALDRQIAAARMARDALDHALRCEHDGIVDCPRFRALVTDKGNGPDRWSGDGSDNEAGEHEHGRELELDDLEGLDELDELEQQATCADPFP